MTETTGQRGASAGKQRRSTRSLSRRIVAWVAGGATVLLIAAGGAAIRMTDRSLRAEADRTLAQGAEQAALVIDHELDDRRRQARFLASLPLITDAARAASDRARALGLDRLPTEELERRYADARTLDTGDRTRAFLAERGASLELAEVIVTEDHGLNAVITERTSDFVQSDEAWWQTAFRDNVVRATADYDESAGQTSLSMAAPLREHEGTPAVGVIKLVYTVTPLRDALAHAASIGTLAVDLIDEGGRLVAGSAGIPTALRPFQGATQIRDAPTAGTAHYMGDVGEQRAAVRTANEGTWRVVAHVPESFIAARLTAARIRIAVAAAAALIMLVAIVLIANRFLRRRLEEPARALASVAESVAAGDLAVAFTPSDVDDEVGRLSRAIAAMIGELRSMADGVRSAARDTASMAAEITTGTEHMSAAAQQMADTSGDLSRQSSEMAETIREMAADSAHLAEISDTLSNGAHEGVERNRSLRTLASQSGERLDASVHHLDILADDAQRSARAIEGLARASDGVAAFVTAVQQIARQSKLLALNASIEATRAGREGAGFGVVANEVRRLAASAADEAGRTEALVADVLRQIADAREATSRTAETVESVRRATRAGFAAFTQVDGALAQIEPWMASIVEAAARANALAGDATQRLDALAKGTEAFAAAMEEVAAATEEQSASTGEISSAATALASSAVRLRELAGEFKISAADSRADSLVAPVRRSSSPHSPPAQGARTRVSGPRKQPVER